MIRVFCLAVLLAAVVAHADEGMPPPAADQLGSLIMKCETRLDQLQQQATDARRNGNILLIIGASVAALGSALAGFLTKTRHRKAMAIIGAMGAVLAVLPKTLDDPTELLTRRAAAERHRDMALKVTLQLPYLPRTYEPLGKQYIVARMVDCTNSSPPGTVPEPPRDSTMATNSGFESLGSMVLNARNPGDEFSDFDGELAMRRLSNKMECSNLLGRDRLGNPED